MAVLEDAYPNAARAAVQLNCTGSSALSVGLAELKAHNERDARGFVRQTCR